MKKLTFLILVCFGSLCLHAHPVDQAQAVTIAQTFYYSYLNITDAIKDGPAVTGTENYYTGNTLAFYIVNFSNKGWVMVSADDDYYPVIGYSDESNLNLTAIPPAMRWWLDGQFSGTPRASEADYEYATMIKNAWKKYSGGNLTKNSSKVLVAPLLDSKWDQGSGYNFHCPEFASGPGGRCYAGCVATAMAQIMYYHKYPEHGFNTHSYSHVFYGIISANFAETTYDWNTMTNIINPLSKEAISTLIYHCGVSVNMNYTPLSSGAGSGDVPEAMISHFNYSNRMKYLQKGEFTNEVWNEMLIDNLQMELPVYYSGSGSAGGHAFVCDGVKDSSFFHFNWGWSGSGNGYFYLSNLNSGNGNFSSSQAAVMNIAPYFYPYCLGKKEFNAKQKTFHDGSKYSLYWNDTDCEWLIAPDNDQPITLIFNSFATEQGHDFLSIYDGADATAPLIGQYSGHDLPPTVVSTGNRLYLRFTTDNAGQDQGWTVTYSTDVTGITVNDENQELTVFPNPATDHITIMMPSGISSPEITFYDLTGKQLFAPVSVQNPGQIVANIKAFSEGFYLVKVISEDKTLIDKFLIQR
ncbi:MAG TPA: C10 family peptidase [Bacteroidales bacterium]|nr:C10 family peptidase [Bacteroidales bacterium]